MSPSEYLGVYERPVLLLAPTAATNAPSSNSVTQLIEATIRQLVNAKGQSVAQLAPPVEIKPALDQLLARADSYRDGMLTLLAYPIAAKRPLALDAGRVPGARTVSTHVGRLLHELQIPGRKDALQTIGRGCSYVLGVREDWDAVIRWASQQPPTPWDIRRCVARAYRLQEDELGREPQWGDSTSTPDWPKLPWYVGMWLAEHYGYGYGNPFGYDPGDEDPDEPPELGGLLSHVDRALRADADFKQQVKRLALAAGTDRVEQIRAAWLYLASGTAETARSVPALPGIDTPRLTFARVAEIAEALLGIPSQGAHEQFVFAAFFEAYVAQLGDGTRVITKVLNAADSSAKVPADVQRIHRGHVIDAFEITGNSWRTKVDAAKDVVRDYELARVHIVASNAGIESISAIAAELGPRSDISVLDLAQEMRSLVHRLAMPYRRMALERLYDHLVERQPDERLVGEYVHTLIKAGVAEIDEYAESQ